MENLIDTDNVNLKMEKNSNVKLGNVTSTEENAIVREESMSESGAVGLNDPNECAIQTMTSKIWEKIKNGEYESAVNEVTETKYHQFIQYETLSVVPVIARLFQEELDSQGEKCLEDIFVYVASVANIKEAALAFLEEVESSSSCSQFNIMLRPIQKLLLRLVSENAQPNIFSWVFNALYARLVKVNPPSDYNLEGKERMLLDADPDVLDIAHMMQGFLDFYRAFYTSVVNGDLVWTGKVTNSREYLALFLLQMFHKPLVYVDIFCGSGNLESDLYRTADQLACMIATLLCNPFKLFSYITWKWSKTLLAAEENVDEEHESGQINELSRAEDQLEEKKDEVSQMSLSCFFYCVLGQHMGSHILPCVYSHQHVYLSCLPLIANLLQEKEHIPIHKGLILAKVLLNNLPKDSLPSDTLEARAHSSFPQLLVRIMVYCDNKELRTIALDIFRSYFSKFGSDGRRKLIQALLLSVKHAGVLGLVIHELKENVACSLKQHLMDPNFSGKHLVKLILMACSLPDAERTDLLEWSDCIMPALNFLIFLFLCDKENKTGVREIVPVLQKDYLAHLEKGIELSKGHYDLKLKELSSPGNNSQHIDTSIYVSGTVLPRMPPDQEKKVVQMALCSLDMMQCVLARVLQAIEN